MQDITYIVYLYQYREMKHPKIDAFRRVDRHTDLDRLPPTVIRWANIAADTKREAITIGRPIVKAEHPHAWER